MRIKRMNGSTRPSGKSEHKGYNREETAIQDMFMFLMQILRLLEKGYFFLAAKSTAWHERAISVEQSSGEVGRFLQRFGRWDYDLYFCPNAFAKPKRLS